MVGLSLGTLMAGVSCQIQMEELRQSSRQALTLECIVHTSMEMWVLSRLFKEYQFHQCNQSRTGSKQIRFLLLVVQTSSTLMELTMNSLYGQDIPIHGLLLTLPHIS